MNNNNSQTFIPPQLKPVFTRCLQSLSYLVAKSVWQIKLQVSPQDLDKIKQLGKSRILYLANHPTLDDGITFFLFSALNGQLFHYLVARDSFTGFLADFLPLVGCYSMRRGVGDRASIVETIKLLQQPAIRLVIFPEGGCSYQNDTVIPFRNGAISMAFQALNKLARKTDKLEPIYLVPLSLKYYHTTSVSQPIDRTLSKLEKALKIEIDNDDYYLRLRKIGQQVINNLAQQYQIQLPENNNQYWNSGINYLKTKMIEKCENKLNISPNIQLPNRERVYQIQEKLKDILVQDKAKNQETLELANFIESATFQLLNFDAIYDGYVAEKPDQERFLDTLNRLERSVFKQDKPSLKGKRKAVIKVANPINLADYYQSYSHNKSETVDNLTQTIQEIIASNL